jgi:phosphoribosylanthranilate isomerase
MARLKVKICGITRLEDALTAVQLGADALGFNFWPRSKRYLAPAAARAIVRRLPPLVTAVGVFVDPTREEILAAVDTAGVTMAQLHGDESPELCLSIPIPVLKAIRVADGSSLAALASYEVRGFVLDTPSPGYGGSGRTFDWSIVAEAARAMPVILAGGLTPENVGEAVRSVRPWAVDVASGVESTPGIKDADKLRRFLEAAREADR